MTKVFFTKMAEFLGNKSRKVNKVKLRQLTLAFISLSVISWGVALIFLPAGLITAGLVLTIINIGWEDNRT